MSGLGGVDEGCGEQLEGRFAPGVLRHTVGQPWLTTNSPVDPSVAVVEK